MSFGGIKYNWEKQKWIWWTIFLYKWIDVWATFNKTWKKIESYPFKLKVKEPYPIKIKPKTMTKDMFILNILIVKAIIKYEMLRYNMIYKQVTQNIYLDILPITYHKELMANVIFSISLLNFFPMIPLNLQL